MRQDACWLADLARYPRRPFLKEQSIWAIWVYRFGRRMDRRADGVAKRILTPFYWLTFRLVETLTGITLPKSACIGPGLRIGNHCKIGAMSVVLDDVPDGATVVGNPARVVHSQLMPSVVR